MEIHGILVVKALNLQKLKVLGHNLYTNNNYRVCLIHSLYRFHHSHRDWRHNHWCFVGN